MNLGEPSLLKPAIASLLAAAVLFATPAAAETYRGLTIAPEHRCSPYSPDDYPYPDCAGPQGSSRLPLDVGSGRGRGGLRVIGDVVTICSVRHQGVNLPDQSSAASPP